MLIFTVTVLFFQYRLFKKKKILIGVYIRGYFRSGGHTRRSFLTANFTYGEIAYGELSHGKVKVKRAVSNGSVCSSKEVVQVL